MKFECDPVTTDPQRAALEALIAAYSGPLTRFFSRRVRIAADVPDLVQEVFLRLSRVKNPEAIENRESFVFVTAANVLNDRFRRAKVRGQGLDDPIDGVADLLEGADFAPDRVLESKQAAERIRESLAELPERTRDVFVLRLLEGWRMTEVAAALKISTRAAEKHQARALAHVADRLKEWR